MTDWKPLVYGTLMILLALFGLLMLYNYLIPSDAKADELFDEFGNKISSFFQDQDSLRDKTKEYFEDSFVPMYNSCLDSEETNCWCTKEKLNIPNGFFVEVVQSNQKTTFNFLDEGKGNFKDFTFVSESCVIVDQTNFLLEGIKRNKVVIESGRTSYISFELDDFENILTTKLEYKNEVDLESLFYKVDDGKICILDKINSELFKVYRS